MAVNVGARTGALPRLNWLTGYGELLKTLLRREIRMRYKGSALGIVWSLVYPLVMMGVYSLVFSVLWRDRGQHSALPALRARRARGVGFFQAGVQLGTSSLIANADLVKKVWFPRELIPAAVGAGPADRGRGHVRDPRARLPDRGAGDAQDVRCSRSRSSGARLPHARLRVAARDR